MVDITPTERAALTIIAREMVQDAFQTGRPNLTKDYSTLRGGAPLPFICIRSREGIISDKSLVSARCLSERAIEIHMAFGEHEESSHREAMHELTRTILGALVHELAHARQCAGRPDVFAAVAARQRESEGMGTDRSPAEWLRSYYDETLEREAHALQVAAELDYEEVGAGPADDPHGAWLKATEGGRRMHARLFRPQQADAAVERWWIEFCASVAGMRCGRGG